MKFEIIGLFTSFLLCTIPAIVHAYPVTFKQTEVSALGNVRTLRIKPGGSLSISFLETGEQVYKVWFSRPTAIEVDGDVPGCSNGSCSSGGASVLYLRIPSTIASNLSISMSIVTQSEKSRKQLYTFNLVPSPNNPHTVVSIVPSTSSVMAETMPLPVSEKTIFLKPRVERGLNRAIEQKLIDSDLENQVRVFLTTYQGDNLQEALLKSDLSETTIQKLEQMGSAH